MFRVCNSCGAFDIDDNHGCDGKVKESLAKSPLTEKAREYKEKYFPDDQAQKPECPFCGDKRGIEHPSPCVCYKPDAQARDTRLDIPDFVPTYTLTISTSEYKIVVEKCDYDELLARCNFMIDSAQQNARERDALAKRVAELEKQRDEAIFQRDQYANESTSKIRLHSELAAAKANIELLRESLILAKKQRDEFNQRIKELEAENLQLLEVAGKEHIDRTMAQAKNRAAEEREQRLVGLIGQAIACIQSHTLKRTVQEDFDKLLKAHRGEGDL